MLNDETPDTTDPVVPFDPPLEQAGTEMSVRLEVEGLSRFSGYTQIELRKQATKLKNQGVQFALPAWTLPSVVLRLRPLSHGAMAVYQAEATQKVRQSLGRSRNEDLPQEGLIEINRRVVTRSILEWTAGEADINGAVRAMEIKNAGVRWAMPRQALPGVVLRLLPLSHVFVSIVRGDREREIREKLGVRRGDPSPPELEVELDRVMAEAAILEWVDGDVMIGGNTFNLKGQPPAEVRAWFRENFFPAPDLSVRPPDDDDARSEFFANMFGDLDHDMLAEFQTAYGLIRRVHPQDVLARGPELTVGADWEYEGDSKYEPGPMASWAKKEPGELRRLFTEHFFQTVELKTQMPRDPALREAHCRERFKRFNNELLNEILQGQDQIKGIPPEAILGKGSAYVVGALDDTG